MNATTRRLGLSVFSLAFLLAVHPRASAVPSFARQTGLSCNMCHSNPPELNAFGRKFKLNGYSMVDLKPDATIDGNNLKINRYFPFSAMLILSDAASNKGQPGTQNGSVQFPQALSLFLSGEIAPHFGGFLQATYSHQDDHFGLDNTDLRYTQIRHLGSKEFLYGVTLNNSPTTEDIWNSTPSWGYPWVSSSNTPTPTASTVIAGGLAQDVAGLGVYTMFNDHLYLGTTAYRSEHAGGNQPVDGSGFQYNVQGVAPYWRAAWQQDFGKSYLMVGTYGIVVSSTPNGVTGARDHYTDPAVDMQFEQPIGPNLLTAHATYIHETSDLAATFAAEGADFAKHHLNTVRGDVNFHIHDRLRLTGAGFSTTGTKDATLFAAAPISGSANGSPDSTGYIAQAGFWATQNIELSLQYTGYGKFNGASTNYDGAGRNASDNNTTYVSLWFTY
jgi:hypothetical protein